MQKDFSVWWDFCQEGQFARKIIIFESRSAPVKGEWIREAFLEHLLAVKGQWKAFASRMPFQKSDKNK